MIGLAIAIIFLPGTPPPASGSQDSDGGVRGCRTGNIDRSEEIANELCPNSVAGVRAFADPDARLSATKRLLCRVVEKSEIQTKDHSLDLIGAILEMQPNQLLNIPVETCPFGKRA